MRTGGGGCLLAARSRAARLATKPAGPVILETGALRLDLRDLGQKFPEHTPQWVMWEMHMKKLTA